MRPGSIRLIMESGYLSQPLGRCTFLFFNWFGDFTGQSMLVLFWDAFGLCLLLKSLLFFGCVDTTLAFKGETDLFPRDCFGKASEGEVCWPNSSSLIHEEVDGMYVETSRSYGRSRLISLKTPWIVTEYPSTNTD